ncbi:MAG: Hpt domain-containing protein [Dokdonella sp.]|uniref:hybrid sensor histidine kinase/response regulator n=1 Tax=Dokdonella sp. TaxID=2291710 RepID=UPI003265F8B9
MKLHDDGEFTALNWVKQALDATLAQARDSLEAYVEEPGHLESMRACVAHLHQVQGTLRMVELYGAAMVVENMERLAEGLVADTIRQREEGYSVLMRGMVQLPDYLERLQSGHKDIPIVLLPLLNDLRACRGENLMTESALFAPDLNVVLPPSAAGSAQPLAPNELRTQSLRLRLAYQAALLKWFRDASAAEHLRRLLDVLDRLRSISFVAEARRLWWIASGVIEAVESGGLEASVAVKLLFGRVDREIHRFADRGEIGFAASPPRELTKNLLYYVAHSTATGARASAIRQSYQLDTLLPTATELQHAQGSMTGRNKNLLGTVSAAIKDDLLRVKEALDIFLRSGNADAAELGNQAEILDRVGDTLGMLGLGVPRRVVSEQRVVIGEMAQRQRPIDEGALLDVAGALLYVESSLDDHIDRLGATSEADDSGVESQLELPQAEVRKILDALMREAAVNIQQAKHDVIEFIESPWNHERVGQIPRLLEEISGALRMLGLADAAQLMTAIVRFVEIELIEHRRIPTAEQMDKLADALAAIEYYLEATREQRRNRDKILDVARESLAALGYWPPPPEPERTAIPSPRPMPDSGATFAPLHANAIEPPQAPSLQPTPATETDWKAAADLAYGVVDEDFLIEAPRAPTSDRLPDVPVEFETQLPSIDLLPGDDLGDLVIGDLPSTEPQGQDLSGLRLVDTSPEEGANWHEVEEEVEEEVSAADEPVIGFQHTAGEEIDDDIREVFIEEVQDEIVNLREQLPLWKRDPANLDDLKAIRRSFHTLKGSGRLVGAIALGEFSWKVESLLNRVLERAIAPSPAIVALVAHAIDAIPVLLASLRGQPEGNANLAGIVDTADRLSAGEDAWVSEHAPATRMVKRIVRRPIPAAKRELPAIRADIGSVSSFADQTGAAASEREIVAGPLPNVDPVLFDILQSEVAAHLGVIEEFLAQCSPQPIAATEELLRAVHTLNGAIAMVDIPSIGKVLAPLENYVKRVRGAGAAPEADGIAALSETVVLTREVMERLTRRAADLPDSTALANRLVVLRDSLPDASLHAYVGEDAGAGPGQPGEPLQSILDPEQDIVLTEGDLTADWVSRSGHESAAPDARLDTPMPADLAAAFADFDAQSAVDAEPIARHDPAAPDVSTSEHPEDLDAAIERALGFFETNAESLTVDADVVETLVIESSSPQTTEAEFTLDPDASSAVRAEEEDAVESFVFETDPEVSTDAPMTKAATVPSPLVEDRETSTTTAPANALLAGKQAPPIADDPQPDGPLQIGDIDDDLLDTFVQEGADILDHSDSLVARLREAPHDRSVIGELQRDLHTLKGGARMAGIAPVGDLSHAMESLIDAFSDGRLAIDRVAVESLERGFDRLHGLVQRVAQRRAVAMPANAIARFESLIAGDVLAAAPPAPVATALDSVPEPAPVVEHIESADAVVDAAPDGSRPAPRHLTAMDQVEVVHAPQEMIRVRSDLLDSLVNYAGEVSIYRSRLEQQIATFRFNLVEFDQTVARLREQLRKLEIETEAQIIARFQREQTDTGIGAFDPLELDRFSQLQQLSRALSESVSDLVSIQGLLDEQTRQSETLLLQQSRVNSDLQEGLMRTRMVPFDSLVPNLRRTLRQAAQELGKRAQLKVDGAHGEMDRNLLERMKAPFEHMLRNALAHGIESPDVRTAAGKPAEGTVNIAVSRESTEVVLRVSDDGAGMDRDAIRRQAIERGLLKAEAQMSDRDLYGFVLESGFSTARELTQLSGRGVGMDVVHNEIKQLGGSLVIDSTPGKGVNFTIRLPFTLAVTQAILVKLGESSYAIPMSSVQGVARIAQDDLDRRIAEGNPKHNYGGEEYTIYDLSQLIGVPRARAVVEETQVPLLMTRTGDQRAAVRIDGVVGSREVVVKSVGPQVSSVPGIFGATIMGDGAVVIILDLAPLVRRLAALRARIEAGSTEEMPAYMAVVPQPVVETRQKPLVMVVDDSITMRKVTTRVLERADYDVVTAKDGLDALEKLQDTVPDLMLLDIEMPRMDGYELATYMRNDSRMRKVPIIMITSRTGEKHRQRALEIGVERYLGKPYQEDDLLKQVNEVLGRERVQ